MSPASEERGKGKEVLTGRKMGVKEVKKKTKKKLRFCLIPILFLELG